MSSGGNTWANARAGGEGAALSEPYDVTTDRSAAWSRLDAASALVKKLVFFVGALNVVVLFALLMVKVSAGDDDLSVSVSVSDDVSVIADDLVSTSTVPETVVEETSAETVVEVIAGLDSTPDQVTAPRWSPPYPDPFEPVANEVQPEAKFLGSLVAHGITNYESGTSLSGVLESVPPVAPDLYGAMVLQVQRVHHPGMWSRGTVEYAQLGGHLDDRISIIVVIRQELGREGSSVPERVETRTMEVRLTGSATGGWALETIASVGGSPVERPTDLDPIAAAVVDHERIDLPDTAVWDIYDGKIDLQLLQLMLDAADRMPYSVVVFQTGHAYNVFGTDRVSNHSVGRAVDIYKFGSELVIDSHDRSSDLYELSEWIVSRYDIREFGSPWLFPEAIAHTFTNEVHYDHVHIGVFQYPTSPDPPPTTTTLPPVEATTTLPPVEATTTLPPVEATTTLPPVEE